MAMRGMRGSARLCAVMRGYVRLRPGVLVKAFFDYFPKVTETLTLRGSKKSLQGSKLTPKESQMNPRGSKMTPQGSRDDPLDRSGRPTKCIQHLLASRCLSCAQGIARSL